MNFLRNAYYALSPVVRRISPRFWYLPIDLFESIAGARAPMVPPRGRIFIGSGDFVKTGEAIRDQLVSLLFHARVKEANVAYDEEYLVEKMIATKGFKMIGIHYGFWSGRTRTDLANFQDICVFRK